MTDRPLSNDTDDRAALVLAKIHVARGLVDGARWILLDATVELAELQTALKQLGLTTSPSGAHERESGEAGPDSDAPHSQC